MRATTLHAEPLRPDQLLLIYNRDDPNSRELATYYAKVRGVPSNLLFGIRANWRVEDVTRVDFDRYIREPIRQHLQEQRLQQQVRCLVTFYGVPIRVGAVKLTPTQQYMLSRWQRERNDGLTELNQAVRNLKAITGRTTSHPTTTAPTQDDYPKLIEQYKREKTAAWQYIQQVTTGAANVETARKLLSIMRGIEGTAGVLDSMQPPRTTQPEEGSQGLQAVRDAVDSANDQINEIFARGLQDPQRDEARKLVLQHHGLLGYLATLRKDIRIINPEETQAAVDSELMLLWWDDYPKTRWVLNTLNWRVRTKPQMRQQIPPTYWLWPVLMASRIDASSPRVARRMIDQAIAAERNGIFGNVYLDARGMSQKDVGFFTFDQDLRDLATMLSTSTTLNARVDNNATLFGPGDCPKTMFYCGWYSLRKYIDAFDFVPGAVGYHLASFEAISLKTPNEQGWCKQMLDDGITATLGSVAEPYLQSFPRPKDFFGLLLTGQFTLAECYAQTSTFNSWMVMLLGDPLYRPFAKNPYLTVEQVFKPAQIAPEFHNPTPQ